jgi:hypothetical protein
MTLRRSRCAGRRKGVLTATGGMRGAGDAARHIDGRRLPSWETSSWYRLLPPGSRIARRLRAHPSGLATLVAKQPVHEQARIIYQK